MNIGDQTTSIGRPPNCKAEFGLMQGKIDVAPFSGSVPRETIGKLTPFLQLAAPGKLDYCVTGNLSGHPPLIHMVDDV